MQLSLIAIGATSQPWVKEGVDMYNKRLHRYTKYQYIETPNLKGKHAKANPVRVMKEEAAVADKHLQGVDHLILLDEHGPQMGSIALSKHLQGLMNRGLRHTAFLIGGPYGFDPSLRARAHGTWSLSKLTFPHELIRICAAEQLYRAHTILKGEPYHHP